MLSPKSTFVALAVLAHCFTTVTAAPVPGIISDIGNAAKNIGNTLTNAADIVGAAFSTDFVTGMLTKDINAMKGAVSTVSGTLDPSLLPDILYFAEFSGVAYCDPKNKPGARVLCSSGVCPTVQANTVTTVVQFDNTKNTDTTGIVARDDTTRSIVITFRGSQSLKNWLANVQIVQKDVPQYCSGCKVHTGFYSAFLEGFPTVLSAFTTLKAANPGYKIVVTGHSLGGAIAALTATELRRQGNQVQLFTYGAPRVGNKQFSAFISNAGKNFRMTHIDDPVPRLPPVFLQYEHISPEFHITRGDSGIKAKDVIVLPGGINLSGNTGGIISLDIFAHLHYFLPVLISDCGGLFDFDFFRR